jgi:hypothetical protein
MYEKTFHLSNGTSVQIKGESALVRSNLNPVPLKVFSHIYPVLPYDEGAFVRVSVVVDLDADRHSVEFTDMGRTDVYFPGADMALRILTPGDITPGGSSSFQTTKRRSLGRNHHPGW